MISEIMFRNMNAVQLENEKIKVIVIPALGGKIVSFYHKESKFEALFQHDGDYTTPTLYSDFSKFDASGFDDAFPNIDAERVDVCGREVQYPDHGEVWSMNFDYKIETQRLSMRAESGILPYVYIKHISIIGDELSIKYDIENTGDYAFPCIWTAHCLTNCDEDMSLTFPPETREVEIVAKSERLGDIGTRHPYPRTVDLSGREYRLDGVLPKEAETYEKYYVIDREISGCCGIYYPKNNVNFSMEYDTEKLPFLGFWVTEGGFRGDYNCALEPSNGYYDAIGIAQKNNSLLTLNPNEKLKFELKLKLSVKE